MSAARKLAVVVEPAAAPRLVRITKARAEAAHPNAYNRRQWLRAVNILRTRTKRGWLADQKQTRIPKEKQL